MDYFLYFDLKLRSKNLGRSYVIKDIPYFLRALKNYSQYSLGSLHYIDLFFDNFDEASQEFLTFLLKIDSKSDEALTKSLYIKNGRYLNIPFLFLEEAMDLVSALENYQLQITGRTVNYFTFIALDNDSEIFKFKVESQQDYIELKLYSEDYHNFYDYSLLYANNVFYKLNQEQRRLLLVLDKQFAKKSQIKFSYADKDKLAQALQQLSTLGEIEAPDLFALMERLQFAKAFNSSLNIPENLSENFFLKILPAFQKLGQIELSPTLRNMRMDEVPEIHIDSQGGLLDISFDIPQVEDGEFANVIAKLQENAEFYISESGKFYHFNEKFDRLKAALNELDDQFVIQGSSLHVNINRSFQISKIFENIGGASFSEKFKSLYQHLTHPEEFPYEKPEHIKASLRSYQETGVRWMSMLSHYNLGGILADDMGLGKTVQAITFILSNLKKDESVLITAPASLTYNWASEFEKFTDEIDFAVIDGTKAERSKEIQEKHQIYITSYGSFLKDFEDYQDKKLNYLLLDEAQVVKNYSSKTNKSLSALNVEHTFALSGTPLENRIEEIWAIFQVVMPGFLPKREKFNKMEPSVISRLIQPFIMRRKKEDVLEERPEKMEITVYNQLADDQKVIYLAQLELMQKQVLEMDSAALSRSRIEILAGITRLRQICNTPALFMDDYKGSSGKLERLRELLAQIKDSGHRPLIFSQFTKVFPHIEKLMEEQEMTAYKLTGSTPIKDRLSMVQAFNAGSRDAFLVSLKAGGVGLNLTSADVVILVDLWWNPAVEEQAIARAHRMGQKNTVEVIRLITKGTIEEKIMEIQERKKDLIANVLEGDTVDKVLSEAEIREILGV